MSQQELLAKVVHTLEQLNIEYMVTGGKRRPAGARLRAGDRRCRFEVPRQGQSIHCLPIRSRHQVSKDIGS